MLATNWDIGVLLFHNGYLNFLLKEIGSSTGEVKVSVGDDQKSKLFETTACYLGEQDGIELLQQMNAKWVCSDTLESQAVKDNRIIQTAIDIQNSGTGN